MVDRLTYLDASALVKLIFSEPESEALRRWLLAHPAMLTSRLAFVEVRRAILRVTDAIDEAVFQAVWDRAQIVELTAGIAQVAAHIGPPGLRSLDAMHVASALALGEELEAFVTYDTRQAEAAREAGLIIAAPS